MEREVAHPADGYRHDLMEASTTKPVSVTSAENPEKTSFVKQKIYTCSLTLELSTK